MESIRNSNEYKDIQFSPVNEQIEFFYKKLDLEKNIPEDKAEFFSTKALNTVFNERFAQRYEYYESAYDQINTFVDDLEGLIAVEQSLKLFDKPNALDKKKIDNEYIFLLKRYGYDLQMQRKPLIDSAAKRFCTNEEFNDSKMNSLKDFDQLTLQHAIKKYGVEDPIKKHYEKTLDELHGKLNDPKEAHYMLIINKKLLPLTESYKEHLDNKKFKKDSPKYEKYNAKYEEITKLIACLKDDKAYPIPTDRIIEFYKQLNESAGKIKVHQKSKWGKFVKDSLLIGLIFATGVVPGFIAMALYAKLKDPHGFYFWNSSGKNLFDTLKKYEVQEDVIDENKEEQLDDTSDKNENKDNDDLDNDLDDKSKNHII